MQNSNSELIRRATGLLIIEVRNSNPNGDPDQESDPRSRYDERGVITGVSFKRKLRDLVDDKEADVWLQLGQGLPADEFQILGQRFRDRQEIRSLGRDEFIRRYWDARLFGNTTLEKKDQSGEEEDTAESPKRKGKKTASVDNSKRNSISSEPGCLCSASAFQSRRCEFTELRSQTSPVLRRAKTVAWHR